MVVMTSNTAVVRKSRDSSGSFGLLFNLQSAEQSFSRSYMGPRYIHIGGRTNI